MSYSEKIYQIGNTDSLHFSDSMETEEKTGSVPVGKTPEAAVSWGFEVEIAI